jgi:hypothetical protein
MNKALYPAIAIAIAAFMESAAAQDISLICTLQSGYKLPLTIAGKKVLKDGRALKNFDRNSFVAAPTRITFDQSFGTYRNAWTIDRDYRQIGFKTILMDGGRVVLEDQGSCTNAAAAPQQARRKPETGIQATIAAMLGR